MLRFLFLQLSLHLTHFTALKSSDETQLLGNTFVFLWKKNKKINLLSTEIKLRLRNLVLFFCFSQMVNIISMGNNLLGCTETTHKIDSCFAMAFVLGKLSIVTILDFGMKNHTALSFVCLSSCCLNSWSVF